MKKLFKLFTCLFLIIAFISCDKEDESPSKEEQKIWLWGYTLQYYTAKKEVAIVDYLFFPADNNEKYLTTNTKTESIDYIKYAEAEEDETYKLLMDKKMIKTTDGRLVSPVASFRTIISSETEAVLPVGKYFVVALYYAKGGLLTGRHYWNKYATKYYTLESRFSPQVITVTIPADLTQCGEIPWINWEDNPYKF